MADELPPIVTEQPPIAPTEPEPAPIEAEHDPEKTYVPLAAVHAEREKAQRYKEQVDSLSQRAAYVEQLQRENALLVARIQQGPQPVVAPVPVIADDEAESLARTLELFDAAGQPDLARARKAAGILKPMAEAAAAQAVAPYAEMTAADRVSRFRQQAASMRDPDGNAINPQVLEAMFNLVTKGDPNLLADQNAATIVALAAAGYERMQGRKSPPPAPEHAPVVSERVGGRADSGPSVSEQEIRMLKQAGRDVTKHREALKAWRPGVPNVLE